MTHSKQLMLIAVAALAAGGFSTPASAQAVRTWVSGVGDDANPCSRTAPCKTFAGAISKTKTGGEINCLDSGGFGSVTITKPIAIICDAVEAGIASAGNGISVNLTNGTDQVLLSGLDIIGATPEGSGIRILGAGTVHIRNTTISMFSGGTGVSFAPSGSAKLIISRSTISGNLTGIAASGGGQVIVTDSMVVANGTGLGATSGAKIVSGGNNLLAHNGSDGQFGSSKARQ